MSVKIREKKLKGKGNRRSLYLDIYNNGEREYDFLNLYLENDKEVNKETWRLAENIRARKQLEIASSNNGSISNFKKKGSFITYFNKLKNERSKNNRAWQNTLNYLKKFLIEKGLQDITIENVTRSFLEQFKEFLLFQDSLHQNTAHNYFVKIKATLNQAVRDEIIETSPGSNVSNIKSLETKRTHLTFEEIQKLANTPCNNSGVKKIFLFCCYTGLRKNDAFNLNWNDFQKDIVKGDVYYRIDFRQQKTKGYEYLYLSKSAQKILNIENIEFDKLKGKRVFEIQNHSQIDRALKVWAARAGIDKNVHFHVSRHSFAVMSLTSGVGIYTLSKMLGHKTLQATEIYSKIVDDKKRQAVDLLPEIEVNYE